MCRCYLKLLLFLSPAAHTATSPATSPATHTATSPANKQCDTHRNKQFNKPYLPFVHLIPVALQELKGDHPGQKCLGEVGHYHPYILQFDLLWLKDEVDVAALT